MDRLRSATDFPTRPILQSFFGGGRTDDSPPLHLLHSRWITGEMFLCRFHNAINVDIFMPKGMFNLPEVVVLSTRTASSPTMLWINFDVAAYIFNYIYSFCTFLFQYVLWLLCTSIFIMPHSSVDPQNHYKSDFLLFCVLQVFRKMLDQDCLLNGLSFYH